MRKNTLRLLLMFLEADGGVLESVLHWEVAHDLLIRGGVCLGGLG